MKKTNIFYWILTGLFAFIMFGSAIPDVLVQEAAIQGFADMGLPKYLVPFVGVAKMLGVIALFLPGMPRLREWAYAGLMIDLIGATYCLAASGIAITLWAPMFIFIAIGFGSYALYHRRRRLKAAMRQQQFNNFNPQPYAQA